MLFEQGFNLRLIPRLPENLFKMEKIKFRNLVKIKTLILHCSDYQPPHSAFDINDWHLKRGWAGFGYHYFINFDGSITMGRRHKWVGSHCKGVNSKSIGICLAGKDTFTEDQGNSLASLILSLQAEIPTIKKIKGHREYSLTKSCPNFSLKTFKEAGRLVYAKKG